MAKIAVLRNVASAQWQSCKTISQNLIDSYEALGSKNEVNFYEVPSNNSLLDNLELVGKIKSNGADEIVWLEYKPTPLNILKAVFKHYSNEVNRPKITIHIYGDFVLNVLDWDLSRELLTNFKVQFLVASEKQKQLLDKFMVGSEGLVSVCPFPVNTGFFTFDEKRREEFRKKLNVEENELLILYSGRLSYQKNIYHTLFSIRDFLKLSSQKVRFVMAGPMDDLGMPYVGRSGPLGAFYGQFLNVQEALSEYFNAKVFQNIGNQNQDELRGLYCAADLLINLSTHNDEDFGMAPAEALCAGCPVILSNWGGFHSFKTLLKEHVRLVDLKKEKGRLLPSYTTAVKQLLDFKKYTLQERRTLAQEAADKLSVQKVSTFLSDNLGKETRFEGYSEVFQRLVATFQSVPNGPFKSHNGQLNGLYFELYTDYGDLDS